MSRTAVVAALLACMGFGAYWLLGPSARRSFSYDFAAPKGFPIIHAMRFNDAQPEPVQFGMIDFVSDTSIGGDGTVAATIPRQKWAADHVTIQSAWIEWKTGKSFGAVLNVEIDPAWGLSTLRFQRDGALVIYRRSNALIAGSLGRVVTHNDFVELARICAAPLTVAEAQAKGLTQARADNFGIDFKTADPAKWPDPGPSFCSKR